MTIVVTDNCLGCRYTECVAVCPVAAFHSDETMVYINPAVCIVCSACIPACPVHAIYDEFDLPQNKQRWIAINAERSGATPALTGKLDPLPTAASRRADLGY